MRRYSWPSVVTDINRYAMWWQRWSRGYLRHILGALTTCREKERPSNMTLMSFRQRANAWPLVSIRTMSSRQIALVCLSLTYNGNKPRTSKLELQSLKVFGTRLLTTKRTFMIRKCKQNLNAQKPGPDHSFMNNSYRTRRKCMKNVGRNLTRSVGRDKVPNNDVVLWGVMTESAALGVL